MRSISMIVLCCFILAITLSTALWSSQVMGKVTSVSGNTINASFPKPVQDDAVMSVLSGEDWWSLAGTAAVKSCSGDGPYEVSGAILSVSDSLNLTVGKRVYIEESDILPVQRYMDPTKYRGSGNPPTHDLRLYYYAAGQTVGYGTLGLGYEKTLRVSRGIGIEADGGITAVGNVSGLNPNVVNTDQLIKSLNGKLRFDFSDFAGFYTAYRWSDGVGDDQHWADLMSNLQGKQFIAQSQLDKQEVMMQGIEYGMTMRPWNKLALSLGFIPQYRADYGTIGVRSQPGYTGELRLATSHGALRIRGIKSDDYWQTDLGVTIR